LSTTFRIIDASEVGRAHLWHLEFAQFNKAIFPRTFEAFKGMVSARSVWCAISSTDEYLGMCYAHFDEEMYEWEIGGLMVSDSAQGQGLGTTLMRVSTAHMIFNEDPLGWRRRPGIVSHVLEGNESPRRIIPLSGFKHSRTVRIPGHVLPGLPTDDDGYVNGDEFCLDVPAGLNSLADWCEAWEGRLKDGTSGSILLLDGSTLATWAHALRDMADRNPAD